MVENEAGSRTTNIGTSSGVVGFYAITPVSRQTVVASSSADNLHAALVNLGLIA